MADFRYRRESRRDPCVVDDLHRMASRIVGWGRASEMRGVSVQGVSANTAKAVETTVLGAALGAALAMELKLLGALTGHCA